ncbi:MULTISPECIES: nuclear transport factor 2 family protein [unclassified Nocardioides]|uniref:nuclear transport factor 2 family protein n=1 Tax=unclassified Nocardioides TaxID=2615069 RepID=UPI0006FB561C|nr:MULTISPECIES: nuclear transport factor 2 family protein [unclassified Nocardioides]KRA31099.1 hypothetical protein ASD81_16580 [Nocardioides sp. Root614]KRA87719.1 hypothetical protein ASD84_16850 [Nocardioides sp. Root682]
MSSDTTDTTTATATGLLAALGNGDFAAAESFLTPTATWWLLSKRGAIPARAWLAAMHELFPAGLRFDIDSVTAQDDRVSIQANGTGTTTHGREFQNAYHFLLRIESGKVAAGWEYGDTLYADKALRA